MKPPVPPTPAKVAPKGKFPFPPKGGKSVKGKPAPKVPPVDLKDSIARRLQK